MHSITKNPAAVFILLATTMLGTTAATAAPPAPAPVTATATDHAAPSSAQQKIQQADALARNGREAMSYIVAARQLLSEQHSNEASQYLDRAKGLLAKLKSEFIASNKKAPDLLPIYSQLGVKEGVVITDQIKQQLVKTHLNAVRGEHKKVIEALKAVDIELQYSFVDLPITATLEKVESALKSLSAKDPKQAVKMLTDAESGLIHDSIVVNSASENPAG